MARVSAEQTHLVERAVVEVHEGGGVDLEVVLAELLHRLLQGVTMMTAVVRG